MGWKGLERNKLDYLLTDMLPVEVSELFSFSQFYSFLLNKNNQKRINSVVELIKKNKAEASKKLFDKGWGTKPLKYNILKGSNSYREMSVINPMSALNVFLFVEAYQKEILDYFEKEHCFSIRYHKKNTALYYKTKNGKYTDYFQKQINTVNRNFIQQTGSYYKISPFESINSFAGSRLWRMCNFKYKMCAKVDYKSCFDSIYTHSYAWIIERNIIDSKDANNSHLFLTIDRILQNINGRSSNGIIVGPEFSRMIAEILLQRIDVEVMTSLSNQGLFYNQHYVAFRYVDDIFLFANEQNTVDAFKNGYLTYAHMRYNIANGFRKAFFGGKDSFYPKNGDLYAHTLKIIIQAVGRICRCRNKNKNIYVFADKEVVERVECACRTNRPRLLNEEFKALLDVQTFPTIDIKKIQEYSSQSIMNPSLYKQVYLGALGEVVGKYILEKELGWDLEEIDDVSHYELFDYKLNNIYFDFKHWDMFRINNDEYVQKVQRKLNRVKGEKAIVINLIKRTEANIKESADEMVIQVPYLIDSESGTINFKIIEKIGELIL